VTTVFPRTWKNAAGETCTAYRVTYYVAGKKKFKQFKTEAAAGRFVRRLDSVINLESVQARNADSPPLGKFADLWLTACLKGRLGEHPLEPETVRTYRGYVENWIKPNIGHLRLRAVKRRDVVEFRMMLIEKCRSRSTASKILTALRAILDYAVELEIIETAPTNKISIKQGGGRHAKTVLIHSKRDMARMITLAQELTQDKDQRVAHAWQRYSLMLELLVYCGLRLSELRGLPRDGVDVKHASLSITQRADRSGRIGPPKSARGRRTLYMPDTLAARLQAWLRTHNHELVFPSASGVPLFGENIRKRMWENIQAKAGVPAYNIHSTRHFYASRLIEDGANLKEISTSLGHADEAFTLRVYGHLFRDPASEARRRQRANTLQLPASD
jgi:integrase